MRLDGCRAPSACIPAMAYQQLLRCARVLHRWRQVVQLLRWPQTLRSSAMRPSCSRTRRLQQAAIAGSCVTITTVWPSAMQLPEQVHDLARGAAVEVAGGLVGQQQLRAGPPAPARPRRAAAGRPTSRSGGAACGHRGRRAAAPASRARAVAPARGRDRSAAARRCRARSCAASGRSSGRRSRSCGCAPRPARSSSRFGDLDAVEHVAPAGRRVQAAEDVHQRRLARARRAGERQVLVVADGQVDVHQRRILDLAEPIGLADVRQLDHCGRRFRRLVAALARRRLACRGHAIAIAAGIAARAPDRRRSR